MVESKTRAPSFSLPRSALRTLSRLREATSGCILFLSWLAKASWLVGSILYPRIYGAFVNLYSSQETQIFVMTSPGSIGGGLTGLLASGDQVSVREATYKGMLSWNTRGACVAFIQTSRNYEIAFEILHTMEAPIQRRLEVSTYFHEFSLNFVYL